MTKVSAVLLKYQRFEELDQIVENLRQYPFIDDIVIHDNSGKDNVKMYGRYFATRHAKHDLIYTQDDDCIVENLQELYDTFCKNLYKTLVNGMKPERLQFYIGSDTLIGWGTFFDRRWLWCLKIYLEKYGMDSIFLRETDRIFSTLNRIEVGRVTVPAKIKDFPSSMSKQSLSLQAEHEQSRLIAVKRCEGLIYADRE